ncbi:MAG: 3-isopropylmalate dehydrogenase [Spirochaetaceae bacterium]|jgi:3-isopropylmalate dehydrogenase|nr:3-isopropylmalate dehydrogenase [Spirochaetaceae bacterium]
MNYSVALIPGDGIGPEIMEPAVAVLEAVGDKHGHVFHTVELDAGGAAIDKFGEPLPLDTLYAAQECHAVLLAAVGGPQWEDLPGDMRPERALLGLRSGLGLFANLRPAHLIPQLRAACPLKNDSLFDMLIVRELTGGLYFGKRGRFGEGQGASAFDTETYSIEEIERVLRVGYEAAMKRRKKLTLVDKANVLESSRLWREVATKMAKEYEAVETDFLYVDNAAMQLVRAPARFDVLVTSNLFGDILSDEASVLTGSIGMLPSASLGVVSTSSTTGGEPNTSMGMYEPIHGSAPDIAGKNIANPLAMILSVAMMLRYSFNMEKEAQEIEAAVNKVLDSGLRTADIASREVVSTSSTTEGSSEQIVGTKEMGKAVLRVIENV